MKKKNHCPLKRFPLTTQPAVQSSRRLIVLFSLIWQKYQFFSSSSSWPEALHINQRSVPALTHPFNGVCKDEDCKHILDIQRVKNMDQLSSLVAKQLLQAECKLNSCFQDARSLNQIASSRITQSKHEI